MAFFRVMGVREATWIVGKSAQQSLCKLSSGFLAFAMSCCVVQADCHHERVALIW